MDTRTGQIYTAEEVARMGGTSSGKTRFVEVSPEVAARMQLANDLIPIGASLADIESKREQLRSLSRFSRRRL